jgi:hypothetical protein
MLLEIVALLETAMNIEHIISKREAINYYHGITRWNSTYRQGLGDLSYRYCKEARKP